jgi:cytidylate kinase
MNQNVPIITIDGPSGSGKGTISRAMAAELGWHLLDSGALYRLVALAAQRAALAPDDVQAHALLGKTMTVEFGSRPDGDELILLGPDREDVTQSIRTETAGAGASRVAAWPEVRDALLQRQRDFAQPPGLVADGRDMGTVVFPEARLKIFLTASVSERAQRRYLQLKRTDPSVTLEALAREVAARDQRDTTRAVAPLVPAPDAVMLDTTGLGIPEVLERVRREVRRFWPLSA